MKHLPCEQCLYMVYIHSKEAPIYNPMYCVAMQLSLQLWVSKVAHRGRYLYRVSCGKFSGNISWKCPLMIGQRDEDQVKLRWNSSKMCVMQFYYFEDYVSNTFAHWSFYIALWIPVLAARCLLISMRTGGSSLEFCDAPPTEESLQ